MRIVLIHGQNHKGFRMLCGFMIKEYILEKIKNLW